SRPIGSNHRRTFSRAASRSYAFTVRERAGPCPFRFSRAVRGNGTFDGKTARSVRLDRASHLEPTTLNHNPLDACGGGLRFPANCLAPLSRGACFRFGHRRLSAQRLSGQYKSMSKMGETERNFESSGDGSRSQDTSKVAVQKERPLP